MQDRNREPMPGSAPPPSWVGYVLAALLILLLAIVVELAALPRALQWRPWAPAVLVLVLLHPLARAINRALRGRARVATPPPIASHEVASDVGDTAQPAAGHLESGCFVVSTSEMTRIVGKPTDGPTAPFGNVLKGWEFTPGGPPGKDWYIVLTKGSAVAFDVTQREVWALKPKDVWASLGGARITGPGGDVRNLLMPSAVSLLAWKEPTWEGFVEGVRTAPSLSPKAKPCPAEWQLMAWMLTQRQDTMPWVRFNPPYGSPQEGLRKLCQSHEDLQRVVEAAGWQTCVKWLDGADESVRATLQPVLDSARMRHAHRSTAAGIACVAIGVVLGVAMYVYLNATISGSDRATVWEVPLVFGGVFVAVGAALILRGRAFANPRQQA